MAKFSLLPNCDSGGEGALTLTTQLAHDEPIAFWVSGAVGKFEEVPPFDLLIL